ncbi:hypothetical protein [Trueperella sp. LYQ143]
MNVIIHSIPSDAELSGGGTYQPVLKYARLIFFGNRANADLTLFGNRAAR